MKNFLKTFWLIGLLIFANSCANYKLHLPESTKAKLSQSPSPQAPLSHTMYLIGDAGKATEERANSVLKMLKSELDQASENSTILFLGDNVYPVGIPPKSKKKKHKEAIAHLDAQLDALTDFKGRPIFIPGNHDWYRYGLNGLKRQERHIEAVLNKGKEEEEEGNYFLPDNGCPGPEVIEINDQLVIIVIDSQWWLIDWDKQPTINSGCDVKTREEFSSLMAASIKAHKDKNIVIATHHPFESNGSHGGRFTVKDHLFPLTLASDKLYMPLPGLGSLLMFVRGTGVSRQDLANSQYKSLRKSVTKAAQANGSYIFASGHEHSLQHIQNKGQDFIVSGAGSHRSAVAKSKKALFGLGNPGFSKIDFYEDGSAWLEFWTVDAEAEGGKKTYRYQLKEALPKPEVKEGSYDFASFNSGLKEQTVRPSMRKIKPMNKFGTFMLGERRRALYLEEYNFPVLDLSTFKGGMRIVKKGGGKQTNSLRLATPKGQEYVMRSLTKDVTRGVPYPFNQLPVVNFLFSETFLGSHPFSPMTLPMLADAAKVYHTNPKLYYVPKQPALGIYNDHFGGEVYLVEERASKSWPKADHFGNANKFINTTDLTQKVLKNHHHHVDQKWLARSRLFDLLIGDFDRHGDQWRWTLTYEDDKNKSYRPIPRDRDNAYATYDGFVMKLLKPYHSLVRQLGTYDEDVGNFKWNYYNARHFDHNFLNQLSEEDWIQEANYIQEHITDELIEKAIQLLPTKAYEMTGPDIIRVLKIRRDSMKSIATQFYKQLAKRSIVYGSNKKEYFEIIRKSDELTEVRVYSIKKKGGKNKLLYERTFKTSETKEIYLYGLDGDDVFHVSGEVDKGIALRVVGGLGADVFKDLSKVKGGRLKDHFYDSVTGNSFEMGTEGKNRSSKIVKNNKFEPLGHQFDEGTIVPAPVLGYNASDGFKIGLQAMFNVHQFNKYPYGQKHHFGLNYAFATKGVDLTYNGVFYESSGRWDFVINSELRNNRYSFNYFGIGNESEQNVDDIDFYRVQQSMIYLDLGWQRRFASEVGYLSFRPLLMKTELGDNLNRFVDMDDNGLGVEDLASRWYGGILTEVNFSNTDNEIAPRDGFRFNNLLAWRSELDGSIRRFTNFSSDLVLYKSFGRRSTMVLASRVGTDLIRGNYDFFFAPVLGEDENIRGLFGQRFRGESSFYHTTDFRMALGLVKNAILPFSFGITGSADYGRVWQPGEDSDRWHNSFGGAVWIAPLNLAILSFSYNRSDDDARFLVRLGHAF